MAADKFILVIGQGRIDGARVHGRRMLGSHRVDTSDLRHEQVWEGDLAEFEAPIALVMRSVGVTAGSAVVVSYASPKSTVEAIAVPARGPRAIQAMRLSLGEAVETPLRHCAVGYQKLWSTRAPRNQTLGLWAAESEITVAKLCAMLGRVGLRVERLVPSRAISLYSCWRTSETLGERDVVVVDVDEQITTMCGTVDGQPRLVRQVGLGTDLFVDAYSRAMRTARGRDGATPGRDEAAAGLWSHGVPGRDDVVDRTGQTRGHDVLPLIQSVVQRLAIEIKQTVRFGMDLDNRRVRVRLSGPGAMVPALAAVLSDHAESLVEAIEPAGGADRVWGPEQVVRRIIDGMPPDVNLLPGEMVKRSVTGSVRRAALIGAGLAAIVIAFEVGVKGRELARMEGELALLKPEVQTLERQLSERAEAARMSQVVDETERRLQAAMGAAVDWHGALAVLGGVSDMGVRLSDIACAQERGRAVMTIRGTASISESHGDGLRALLAMLSSRPEFEGVSLGATRLEQANGRSSRTFSISMELRSIQALATHTGGER